MFYRSGIWCWTDAHLRENADIILSSFVQTFIFNHHRWADINMRDTERCFKMQFGSNSSQSAVWIRDRSVYWQRHKQKQIFSSVCLSPTGVRFHSLSFLWFSLLSTTVGCWVSYIFYMIHLKELNLWISYSYSVVKIHPKYLPQAKKQSSRLRTPSTQFEFGRATTVTVRAHSSINSWIPVSKISPEPAVDHLQVSQPASASGVPPLGLSAPVIYRTKHIDKQSGPSSPNCQVILTEGVDKAFVV